MLLLKQLKQNSNETFRNNKMTPIIQLMRIDQSLERIANHFRSIIDSSLVLKESCERTT